MTNKDKNRERMLRKIRKLLAMAADVGSPNEAAVAARQASAMMRKYNIEHADVLVQDLSADDITQRSSGNAFAAYPRWLSQLCIAVGDYTQTYAIFDRIKDLNSKDFGKKMILFRGHVDDLELADYLYRYLDRTIRGLARRSDVTGRGSLNQFKLGAVIAIREKLAAMRDEEVREVADSGDMAVVLYDKKRELLVRKYGPCKYRKRMARETYADAAARGAGYRAGSKVSIRRGINGASNGGAGVARLK